ncbi:MAG: hypothetical protein Q4B26_08580 [Eubacteriales bacterium]|nr:hypothetical protein [Eubacteriales bacterium]
MTRLQDVLTNKEENYMLPFFWQHGEDEATLREYMRIIQAAHIGAVCVESRPHPDFVGEKWWADMDVILDEAKKRDMKVWILDDSHFPTGYANGAMANAPKELQHKYLCYRTLEMAGPVAGVEFALKDYTKPAPLPPWLPPRPVRDDDFADTRLLNILAYPICAGEELGEPIELTACVEEDGMVRFDLPEGYFKIFISYITRDGKGRNDYINFMDEASCRLLIDAVYEPHFEHYKEYFGNTILGFFSDEPPVGNVDGYIPVGKIGCNDQDLPWSDAAEAAFNEVYGSEEWKTYVGYLWADGTDKDIQAKVRNAYMDMVTRLVEKCFSNQNAKWCEDHGVEYIGHMLEDCDMNMGLGASMGHFFRGLAGQHMAGIDNIGGQVTIGGQNVPRHDQPACQDEAGYYQYVNGKLGASHASIDPKKQGRCMCENFGAYGWQSGPKEQKFMMDHFMVRGVNRFVPHAFSPAPFPDPDCPPHFYAHGENPTFLSFGDLMAYSNRVCHLIDGGKACPDVAVLYAAESVWAGNGDSNIPTCRTLSEGQIDFHIIPSDVFAENEEYPCEFDGKTLQVNGVAYGALVISGASYVDPDVATFIEKAEKTGFPVIFVDHKPADVCESVKVVPLTELVSYIKETGIALQAEFAPANKLLTTYHYELEGKDEYFFLNEMSGSRYEGTVTILGQGTPVRYYPWENRLEAVSFVQVDENHVKVELSIDPLELCILVFDSELAEKETVKSEKESFVRTISEFAVAKAESKDYIASRLAGEPVYAVKDEEAVGCVQAPYTGMQKQYPDFSGFYIYQAEAEFEEGATYILEIDHVCEAAEVFVDGESLGTKVQAPYRFVFCNEKGENHQIRVDVATLTERKARALGANVAAMSVQRPFSPTGILGNVNILKVTAE